MGFFFFVILTLFLPSCAGANLRELGVEPPQLGTMANSFALSATDGHGRQLLRQYDFQTDLEERGGVGDEVIGGMIEKVEGGMMEEVTEKASRLTAEEIEKLEHTAWMDSKMISKFEPELKTTFETDLNSRRETASKTESETESKTESETESKTKSETESKTKSETEFNAEHVFKDLLYKPLGKKKMEKYEGKPEEDKELSMPTLIERLHTIPEDVNPETRASLMDIEIQKTFDWLQYDYVPNKNNPKGLVRKFPEEKEVLLKKAPATYLESNVGRGNQLYGPHGHKQMVVSMPFRKTSDDRVEVLMITSSNPTKQGLIIAKGGVDEPEKDNLPGAALRENGEETGFEGVVTNQLEPVTIGPDPNIKDDRGSIWNPFVVQVKQDENGEDIWWDQYSESIRGRAWIEFTDALKLTPDEKLRQVLISGQKAFIKGKDPNLAGISMPSKNKVGLPGTSQ